MNPLLIGLQPLRRYADFRGRSTRTELICFNVLIGAIGFVLNAVSMFAGMAVGLRLFGLADLVGLAVICPALALCVRRLHDSGRSGWWLLLALPGGAISLRRQFLLWQNPFDFSQAYLPAYFELPAALLAVGVCVLLLWKDDELSNRYGPNPRYPPDEPLDEPPGEPA
jgi:uncharacterized membrane protein YhaH (DUF805 family)